MVWPVNQRMIDTIKAYVLPIVDVVTQRRLKDDCQGCAIQHPSQRRHECLQDPPLYHFYNNFEDLVMKLWTPSFLSNLMCQLGKRGMKPHESRVCGMAECILNELKEAPHIAERIFEELETLGKTVPDIEELGCTAVRIWTVARERVLKHDENVAQYCKLHSAEVSDKENSPPVLEIVHEEEVEVEEGEISTQDVVGTLEY
ncbi:uncharacterized protein LOC121711334 [Alosa sapidissima]|uniref:uncharacterized protein LOC121711334 n=1 Tax=Alosa sapidissima TaxID=34773 RepID=UPI001C08375B|nr:uncharacterized protein LOC121711334 [Alosa sapidissima]